MDLLPDVLRWLDEAGVPVATADTAVSSLNLVWIVSKFEDNTGLSMENRLAELAEFRTAGGIAEALARMLEGVDE